MPRKSHGEKRIDGSISGLSNALEEHQKLRRRALKTGSFLTWPTPEQKGVMNFENLALNHEVIEILIRLWAPQWAEPIMIPVDDLKNEARYPFMKLWFLECMSIPFQATASHLLINRCLPGQD